MELPWTEKYRPNRLSDVVGHERIVERLQAYVKQRNMPNMLFAGPPGIGKTVCAVALGKELFGDDFKRNFLELNASDERGIDIIRGKIKDFASSLAYGRSGFKIIFLDEADALTKDAQNALRRTMEKFAGTTRFILSCNYSGKIIEPIQSRCAVFRFKPLNKEQIIKRLQYIAEKEKLHVDKKAYEALVYVSEGDMRKAINFLQTASTTAKKITEAEIYKVATRAKPEEIKKMLSEAIKGKFEEARKQLDILLYEYGMSGEDVMAQIYSEINAMEIDAETKLRIIDKLGEYNFRISEGANERIQMEAFLAYLVLSSRH
ncbi:replication factor C small subunit [Candidatus Micrarchaeota archaeon]|nr:MAG: replication factor C small subunit [Candidatus Micrarchaeota archaeon]